MLIVKLLRLNKQCIAADPSAKAHDKRTFFLTLIANYVSTKQDHYINVFEGVNRTYYDIGNGSLIQARKGAQFLILARMAVLFALGDRTRRDLARLLQC